MHRLNTGARRAGALAAALLSLAPQLASAQDAPKSVAEAVKMEAEDSLPITAFYDIPASLASTKPGALLRQETFDGYSLPKGASATRILYHSRDAEGQDVVSSAVILIPAGAAPAGGWPVIAWAHGTSGVARQCAPSLMKDVYYGEEGLMPMVRAGYAVIAPDYHGQGTSGVHQYINKTAQAYDVIYTVPAAHEAVKGLDARWVVTATVRAVSPPGAWPRWSPSAMTPAIWAPSPWPAHRTCTTFWPVCPAPRPPASISTMWPGRSGR